MSYRESADASGELRFTDRQREWIEVTTTEVVVRANLRGEDPLHEAAMDSTGYALFGGGIAAGAVATLLLTELDGYALLVGGLAVALLGVAAARYASRSKAERSMRIVTGVPAFERRGVRDASDNETVLTFAMIGDTDIAWLTKLERLRKTLSETDEVRVCIVARGRRTFIAWAYPMTG